MIDKEKIKDVQLLEVGIDLWEKYYENENPYGVTCHFSKGERQGIDNMTKLEAIKKAKEILTLMEKEIEG